MTNLEGFSAFGLPIVVKPITEDYGDDVTTVTSSCGYWGLLHCIGTLKSDYSKLLSLHEMLCRVSLIGEINRLSYSTLACSTNLYPLGVSLSRLISLDLLNT